MIKQSGCPPSGDCPPNEYGDKRFMIRVNVPLDYCSDGGRNRGQTIFLFDRRRSIFVRGGPDDILIAKQRENKVVPFDKEGHKKLMMIMREKGIQRQLLFMWAKRIGDTLEIE